MSQGRDERGRFLPDVRHEAGTQGSKASALTKLRSERAPEPQENPVEPEKTTHTSD